MSNTIWEHATAQHLRLKKMTNYVPIESTKLVQNTMIS